MQSILTPITFCGIMNIEKGSVGMKPKYIITNTGIIDWCMQDEDGTLYKVFIYPDFIIDKCDWAGFKHTAWLTLGLRNLPEKKAEQFMNKTYVDRVNLVKNIKVYNQTDIRDKKALQKLIDDKIVTIKPDDYEFRHSFKTHQICREEHDPVILNITAYDTYEEAEQALTISNQPLPYNYRVILREAPVELLPEIYNFLHKLPPKMELHWRGHQIRYKQPHYKMDEPIWEIPEDWIPDIDRFETELDCINYYLDINRHRRVLTENLARITNEVGQARFRQAWFQKMTGGYNITDYIFKRKLDKVADLLKNTDLSCAEINEITGVAESVCNFYTTIKKRIGCTPSQWKKKLRESQSDS